jgi:hypothetical protein
LSNYAVEQFAEDIRRHLGNLPVVARKDTAGYRVSKFITRHRAGLAGSDRGHGHVAGRDGDNRAPGLPLLASSALAPNKDPMTYASWRIPCCLI